MCPPLATPICKAAGGIGSVIGGSVVDQVAQALQHAESTMIGYLASWWVNLPSAAPQQPGGQGGDYAQEAAQGAGHGSGTPDAGLAFIVAHTQWLVASLAVFGLLVGAGRLAWERRGEPARQALGGLVTLTVVTACAISVVSLSVSAGDDFSNWIINASLNTGGGGGASSIAQIQTLMDLSTSTAESGLIIILAPIAILACLVEVALLIVRIAMVALLTAVLPIGAAVSGTGDGKAMFRRQIGWLIAFVLYKPTAAIIFAFAFASMNNTYNANNKGLPQIVGITMLILAVLALPALMRFINPLVSPATADVARAGGMAGMAMASGARAVGGLGQPTGGPGGEGGRGEQGPQGSDAPAGGRTSSDAPPGPGGPNSGQQGPPGPPGGSGPGSGGPGGPPGGPGGSGPAGPTGGSTASGGSAASGAGSAAGAVPPVVV